MLITFHDSLQFILSTAIDGKIKAWFYDSRESTFDYAVPGKLCTTIAYSDDGSRYYVIFKDGSHNSVS